MSDNANSAESDLVTITVPPDASAKAPTDEKESKGDLRGQLQDHDLKSIERIVAAALGSEEERQKVRATVMSILKRVGALASTKESEYDPSDMMECAVHYMRWQPDYLFECPVQELHQYEMCMAAHVLYVKTLENYFDSLCDIADKNQKRARKLAAAYCPGKSVGEREAVAMEVSVALSKDQRTLDKNMMLRTQLKGLSEIFMQMDNSLKKTIERRRTETLADNGYEKGRKT